MTEFPTPSNLTPGSIISTGPDGNLWFTLGGSIGRMTPAGAVTSFQVPGTFNVLAGLTTGPDGNLWFTEREDGQTTGQQPAVGVITPAGVTTLHTLSQGTTLDPSRGVPANPGAITAGPDGNLWFIDSTGIGRMTTTGLFQQFNVPASLSPSLTAYGETGLDQITSGPDSTVWFTLGGTAADGLTPIISIGRITTAGAMTLYPLPDGSSIAAITAGPDGNVWFTDDYSDPNTSKGAEYIGRITPRGQIKKFNLQAKDVTLSGITTGPDHNLWFTGEKDQGSPNGIPFIGRITTRGQVQVFDFPPGKDPGGSYGPSPATSPISGPDGTIWFETTINNNGGIARISTKGKLEGFVSTDQYYSSDMVTLPGGRRLFRGRA